MYYFYVSSNCEDKIMTEFYIKDNAVYLSGKKQKT